MKLVILAAGESNRLKPVSNGLPKALFLLLNKPLAEYILDMCLEYVTEVIFVVNKKTVDLIKLHFGNKYKNISISYVLQNDDFPKGTMSALLSARDLLKNDDFFTVCNCDDLYRQDDIKLAFEKKVYGVGLTTTIMPWSYHGVLTERGLIKGFVKHANKNPLVQDKFVNGFYMVSNKIFSFKPTVLQDGEWGLPQTLFANLESFPLQEIFFSDWVAVNSPTDIPRAETFIKDNYLTNL